MQTVGVGPSDWLWKEGSGYYTDTSEALAMRPVLPDLRKLRDWRLFDLFETHGGLVPGSRVLEVGCGRSPWLPFLARNLDCRIAGIDIEPHAAELARANLKGAGARGEVICGDAFALSGRKDLRASFDLLYSMGVMEHYADVIGRLSILAGYLRPGGRILTTVPNLQGVNWLLQRLGSLQTLRAHVVYDIERLVKVHEAAGFQTIASGYVGFFDGHVTSAAGTSSRLRRNVHRGMCRALGRCSEAWLRLAAGRGTPELNLTAPHVFYVGRRVLDPDRDAERSR
jgi:2-polyprenyl-3-methyl-5-hydroxy-6-metoxy-1,4-benzoquinol methylase